MPPGILLIVREIFELLAMFVLLHFANVNCVTVAGNDRPITFPFTLVQRCFANLLSSAFFVLLSAFFFRLVSSQVEADPIYASLKAINIKMLEFFHSFKGNRIVSVQSCGQSAFVSRFCSILTRNSIRWLDSETYRDTLRLANCTNIYLSCALISIVVYRHELGIENASVSYALIFMHFRNIGRL